MFGTTKSNKQTSKQTNKQTYTQQIQYDSGVNQSTYYILEIKYFKPDG